MPSGEANQPVDTPVDRSCSLPRAMGTPPMAPLGQAWDGDEDGGQHEDAPRRKQKPPASDGRHSRGRQPGQCKLL